MEMMSIVRANRLNIILIFIITIIICLPFIMDGSILKTNDLSGNVVNLVYIKKMLIEHGVFPKWNPLLNEGIPIVADPLNTFYNPIILLTFLVFPLFISIKLTYIISIFLSGLFFYFLLKQLNIERNISLPLSFTFMSSGYMAARIYAGHLEKILSYPLVPLLLLSILILLKKGGIKWSGIVAGILTLFVFSGAIYETLYAFIVLGSIIILYIGIFIVKQDKKYIPKILFLLISCFLFMFFSAVKILPLTEISTYILHVSDPFRGSQSFISLLYNLFFPYNGLYLIFGISNFNPNTPYFWWESYAFIGSLPFFCLFLIPFIIKKGALSELKIFSFLLFVIISFSMLGSPLNLFTWIFNNISFLQQFRIPSRIFLFLIPVILTLNAIVLNYFYKTKGRITKIVIIAILSINFLNVLASFNAKIYRNSFIYTPPISDLQDILNQVKKLDDSYYLIGQSQFFTDGVPIYPAINNEQLIYNHNYGYLLKKTYSLSPNSYLAIAPKYYIFPKTSKPPSSITYKKIYQGSKGSKLYKNKNYTAYVDIYSGAAGKLKKISTENMNLKNVEIMPDKITVTADSTKNNQTLLILESFAPGWKAVIDNKQNLKLLKNDFLNIPLEKGEHTYTFTYHSTSFIAGFLISFFSFLFWLFYAFGRHRFKAVGFIRRLTYFYD